TLPSASRCPVARPSGPPAAPMQRRRARLPPVAGPSPPSPRPVPPQANDGPTAGPPPGPSHSLPSDPAPGRPDCSQPGSGAGTEWPGADDDLPGQHGDLPVPWSRTPPQGGPPCSDVQNSCPVPMVPTPGGTHSARGGIGTPLHSRVPTSCRDDLP